MDQNKKGLQDGLMIVIILLVFVIAMDWLFFTGILNSGEGLLLGVKQIFYKMQSRMTLVRFLYALLLFLMCWLNPSFRLGRTIKEDQKIYYQLGALFLSLVLIAGYSRVFVYNLVFLPIIFLMHILIMARAVSTLKKRVVDDAFFKTVSSKDSEFCYEFPTDLGLLKVHLPNYHIFVDGGPGSGKSETVIKPVIDQSARKQYSMVIYDFKGDPRQKGLPDLCNTAYCSVRKYKKLYGDDYKLKFAFINFVDLSRTVRVNLLSDRYIESFMDIKDLGINMFKNLSKFAKEKMDFWAEYGASYIYGVMYMHWKNNKELGFNTIPHVISTCLSDINLVFEWLITDPEIDKLMQPLITAYNEKAGGQLSGGTSTGQLPFASLYEKNIYWVLSSDDFDLDISREDNLHILGVANSNRVKEAITPVVSCILSVIMNKMNVAGNPPSVFCIDELPTVNINGLDQFMATVRSNNVCALLSVQDFKQLERDYGKDSASIIRAGAGNLFQGMTSSHETTKQISDLLGDIEKVKISYTENMDSMSSTESKQKEKVMQTRDIAGQAPGHFTGKIAGGTPPFFSTQFKRVKTEKIQIPEFSKFYNTGDPEQDKKIMDNIVQANFVKINNDIAQMLEPFKELVQKKRNANNSNNM
jgi:Type IV secretory pathway, VirD4 components